MSNHEPTLKELFEDGRAIDEALKEAARDARRLHKALGNPMATWEDGQVVWCSNATASRYAIARLASLDSVRGRWHRRRQCSRQCATWR